MKRTPLKRKTPLKAKTALKASPLKKKTRKKKTPLAKLKKQLWAILREIQLSKYGRTCYTCYKTGLEGGNCQLGHFIPSSVCSTEMRYDLDNLRPQCYHCNINLSGNWIAYEKHLTQEGIDVQKLKARNEKTKGLMYREDWYENKIQELSTGQS